MTKISYFLLLAGFLFGCQLLALLIIFFFFQSWMNATAVRFSFSGLYRKFDNMATKWVGKPCYLHLERLPTRILKIHYLGKTVSSLLRPLFLAARQNGHTFSCKKSAR